jgi:hypothetical protein
MARDRDAVVIAARSICVHLCNRQMFFLSIDSQSDPQVSWMIREACEPRLSAFAKRGRRHAYSPFGEKTWHDGSFDNAEWTRPQKGNLRSSA